MGSILIVTGADFSKVALGSISSNYVYLSLSTEPEGAGIVTGGGEFKKGESVEISATPNYGYIFKSWSDGDTNQERTVVMTSDLSLTAVFEKIEASYYFDNISGNEYSFNEVDYRYFPIHLPADDSYTGKPIKRVKVMSRGSGTFTFAIYDSLTHKLKKEIGTYEVVDGVNEIELKEEIIMEYPDAFGISSCVGLMYSTSKLENCLHGSYAEADFEGTLAIGLGF